MKHSEEKLQESALLDLDQFKVAIDIRDIVDIHKLRGLN